MVKKKHKSYLIWGTILIIIGLLAFKFVVPLLLIAVGGYLIWRYYQEK